MVSLLKRLGVLLLFVPALFSQANLPSGTTASGTINYKNIAAPSTPASGRTITWTDSTSKLFCAKNDAGTLSCTVIASSAPSHQFFNSLSAGAFGSAQPSFADLSSSAACSQLPALTGDTTTSAGSCATLTGKVNGVTFPSSPSTNTVPVVTGSNTITYEIVPVAAGGTGTASPGLVAGANVTITGSWPNQTVNATGGTITRTICGPTTGLSDTLTAAGTFATTCTIPANSTVFGTRIDIYGVGKEHIVSGDNHQYGFVTGEGSSSPVGHSAAIGDFVWAVHFVFYLLYDGSISAIQSGGATALGGDCALYQRNGGTLLFACGGSFTWTPSSSHTLGINAVNFQASSTAVLTEFWVTQTN